MIWPSHPSVEPDELPFADQAGRAEPLDAPDYQEALIQFLQRGAQHLAPVPGERQPERIADPLP